MNYCARCKRYLNGALSCAGCGSMAGVSDDHPTLPLPAIRIQELVPLPESDARSHTRAESSEEEQVLVQDAAHEAAPAAPIVVGAVVELWEMLEAKQAAAAASGAPQHTEAPEAEAPEGAGAQSGAPVGAAPSLSALSATVAAVPGEAQAQAQTQVPAQQADRAESGALFAGAAPRSKPSRNLPSNSATTGAQDSLNQGNLEETAILGGGSAQQGPGSNPNAASVRNAGMSHLPTQRPIPAVEVDEDPIPVPVPVPVPLSMPSAPPAAAAASGADEASISYEGDAGSDFLIPTHTSHRSDDEGPRRGGIAHVSAGVLVGAVAVAAVVVGGVIFTSSPGKHDSGPPPSQTGLVVGPTLSATAGPTFVADGRAIAGQSAAPGHPSVTPTASNTLGATPAVGASGGLGPSLASTPTAAPKVVTTTKPPAPNPFTITASKYSNSNSVGTEATTDSGGGDDVGWIANGSWLQYNGVTFPADMLGSIKIRMASLLTAANIGTIQFRLNSPTGPAFATVTVNGTGGWQQWITVTANESPVPSGTYSVFVTFSTNTGGDFVNVNWFQFS